MKPTAYKHYVLVLLTLIMVFNYVDRLAMGLLLQDIKTDLSLSDTQLGLLTGIAFAAFYATMGIPIARWADRGNRVTIISFTTALWSVAVAICGAAGNFLQMLLMRIGVGVGEAGCHPPAFSLLADYFPREERPRAVARYMLGWPLALLIGNFAAGWLNELYGWRMTFVIIGIPGLLLSILTWLTLKEPRQLRNVMAESGTTETTPKVAAAEPGMMQVLKTLWGSSAYRHLLIAFSLTYFFATGMMQWQPAFFVRTFGMGTGALGTWFAVIYGVGGLLGTYLGGEMAARYAAGNERLQFRSLAIWFAVLVVLGGGIYLAPNRFVALGVLVFYAIGTNAVNGPMFSATQALVPPHMRAMSIAVILFFSHLVGLGFGSLAVGALSDALHPLYAADSLRYALLAFCPGYLWCAWHLWRVSKTVMIEMAQVNNESLTGKRPVMAA